MGLPPDKGTVKVTYLPALRSWITPEVAKATILANPLKAVCAPFDSPTAEFWPETDGVASNVAVKLPLREENAVSFHVLLAVAIEQALTPFVTAETGTLRISMTQV